MHQRQVKEDSSVFGLRKWGEEGSSGMSVPEVPKEGRWTERRGGNIHPASLHLSWGLKQPASHLSRSDNGRKSQ